MTLNKILEKENLLNSDIYDFKNIISTDPIIGVSFCALKKYNENSGNVCIVAPNLYTAEQIRDFLVDFVGNENLIYLPSEELIESEFLAASPDIRCERVNGISSLFSADHKIILMNVATALRYYSDPQLFLEKVIKIKVGDIVDFKDLKSKTLQNGYIFQNRVEKSGDFSYRGDIFDIFPFNAKFPIRIEFFDDEIESIRYFKVETQESFDKVNSLEIIPATDVILSLSELENMRKRLLFSLNDDQNNDDLRRNVIADLERLEINFFRPEAYKYYSFLQERNYTIFDYFKADCVFFSDRAAITTETDKLNEDAFVYLSKSYENNKNIKDLQLFYEYIKFERASNEVVFNDIFNEKALKINLKKPIISTGNIKSVINSLKLYEDQGYKIYYFFENEQQLNFFKTSLELEKYAGSAAFLEENSYICNLSSGIEFVKNKILFLSAKELFGVNYARSKYETKFRNSQIIKSFDELNHGDYIVHEKYGIGVYQGIKILTTNGFENDYIELLYEGNQKLYIPQEHFKYIRKYVGREGYVPKLSKLFSGAWDRTKKKVEEKVDFLAEKLSVMYRERDQIKGFAFEKDDEFQIDFENKFPYALTEGQKQTVEEIKKDMESSKPMNRLVCGDVGFGKTEVAFRAAFKCLNNGKQVLLLCPTTVLAKQHFERALERFSGFGINIVCLTRFLSAKELRQASNDIVDGKVHFIIGTHKALSKNIVFNDLGLLIIDEEQRFGVEHKEIITLEQKNIDVLTLSATPIPRTLQQALVGMKSISVINSAPLDRNPIQTYLIEHDMDKIYSLISRELGRSGQVYYVHNNVSTILEVKRKIEAHIPNVIVDTVHGQMSKKEIEDTMTSFYKGDTQVLVSTTIIENGIDVGRANLIIIENADCFGLAQLYQLKGRVGRSNRLAYAFLTYNPKKELTDISKMRLKAIQEFTELGSGYKIAQRDLLIRGAGDILGREQAGFIDDVGIDLYLKMLNDAIAKRDGSYIDDSTEYKKIFANGYIPDEFALENEKFEIYKWVDSCKNIQELQGISKKIEDIYGKIPEEFINVLKLRKTKIMLLNEEFLDFTDDHESFTVYLSDKIKEVEGIGSKLLIKLYQYKKDATLSIVNGQVKVKIMKRNNYIDFIYSILNNIHNIYVESKNETR